MSKKIIHYRNDCIGCNICVEIAPDNWFMNLSDGKATLRRSREKNGIFVAEISKPETESNLNVARSCPVNIIKIIDENGHEIQ